MADTDFASNGPGNGAIEETRPGEPRPLGRRLLGWLIAALLGCALVAVTASAVGIWTLDCLARRRPDKEKVLRQVTIERGSSVQSIARALEREGLIERPRLFSLYAWRVGKARSLQAGQYRLDTQMTVAELVEALQQGRFERQATIPEGFTIEQIARRLADEKLISDAEEFLALAADPQMLVLAAADGPTVEGYLFPDTYLFDANEDARAIMIRMIRAFDQQAAEALADPSDQLEKTLARAELVALASMIEREARSIEEMPSIASVYYNRLAKGMRLQCDATVRYAMGVWDRPLRYEDLEFDSPYNTYEHNGLPPGPICNPGAEALRAAAHPAETAFLFYVYRGGDRHEFSATYQEHLRAKKSKSAKTGE
jgi:UPF0755 protein